MAHYPWHKSSALVSGPTFQQWLRAWLKAQFADVRPEYLCLPLTLFAVAHLAAAAIFPGGYNAVLNLRATSAFSYLSYFPAADTLGFPAEGESTRFLLYKIYAQNGDVLEGTLPDPRVRPRLRYERWAAAGNLASGPLPNVHASIMVYLVSRLPEPPLRVEMFSARWVWDHNKYLFPWRGFNRDNALELHLLGTYNGLTRVWNPAAKGPNQ